LSNIKLIQSISKCKLFGSGDAKLTSNPQKLKSISEILVQLLEDNQSIYLEMWRENILIDQRDIYKDMVKETSIKIWLKRMGCRCMN
jgi:hypothetical protein